RLGGRWLARGAITGRRAIRGRPRGGPRAQGTALLGYQSTRGSQRRSFQKQSDRRPSVGDQGRIWTWHPTAHRYAPRSPKSLPLAIIAPKRTVDAEPCALGSGWFGEFSSCGSRSSTFVMARRLQLSVDD